MYFYYFTLFALKINFNRFLPFMYKILLDEFLFALFFVFITIFINYFPKQNFEKISLIISSVTNSPVIFPKSSKISFI